MGEAALSAFLEVLLDRVASRSVLDFFKDNKLDHGLLRKLKRLLLAVNKVLDDDAEVKQITDNVVKEWLRDLQDAVYEFNDLLDAVNAEAMQIQLEKKNQSSSTRNMDELSGTKAKLNEFRKRLNVIVEEKHCLDGVSVPEKPSRHKTSLPDEFNIYGRDNDTESIVKLLLAKNSSDNSPDVITIKGMGGIGKTTLAQLVYNDERIAKHFKFQAWVCISEEFDVFKVTKTILQKFTSSPSVADDLDLMQVELKNNLVGKNFLVVLDDVWEENRDYWDLLKKPLQYGLGGSKVIVTTRNDGVAQIMRTVPTHYLKKLSDEDCWELFAKYAFEGGESQPHQSFIDLGQKIVEKCGGLPLAAKALGSLLRPKKTIAEWSKIMESNVWDLKRNIIPVLLVSYLYLPARLKCCFAFASIFPKNYKFKKEELILLWAAQSFFPEGKNVLDIGNEYFNELISRSFFEQSTANSSLFVMHDLMHDLATLVSRQSCRCCVNLGDTEQITNTTRHMSYSKTSIRQFQTLPATNTLRTFTQLKEYNVATPPKLCSDVLLTRFKLLRVLSLRHYEIEVLPETIGSLKHLRCFDLSKTKIKTLPNSICDLYNLQTLILTSCSHLKELPTHMCKLVNLHHLDVTGCHQLRELPRTLGKLKTLRDWEDL